MVGPMLSGEKVNLRLLRDDDLERRVAWLNDAETVSLFTGVRSGKPYDLSDAARWRHNLEADTTAMIWAIETKDDRHIGDVDIHSVDRFYRSGKLTILIGAKDCWGCGCGSDALTTLLRHAFGDLRLLNIDLRVFAFNKRAIRCYQKCGFVESRVPSPGQMGASEPGEVYMTISRERFLFGPPNAIVV